MPHKHTRRGKDEESYDLPPNKTARPLPVVAPKTARLAQDAKSSKTTKSAEGQSKNLKRKRGDGASKKDDAPRAFKRLMAFTQGAKVRDGLDDGRFERKTKKKAAVGSESVADSAALAASASTKPAYEVPTIQPGERMSDFAARVDRALPISGLVNKSVKDGKDPLGLKVSRTKKERKMHKLYDEWRKEDEAIKERRREEQEEAEEREMDEDGGLHAKWNGALPDSGTAATGGSKKKGKKGGGPRSVYEAADADDGADPWDEIKKKRGEARPGLNDVVKAPPAFKHVPKQVLNVRGAGVEVGSIPKAAGSLRRREELQTIRNDVVASYRKLMAGRRPALIPDGQD